MLRKLASQLGPIIRGALDEKYSSLFSAKTDQADQPIIGSQRRPFIVACIEQDSCNGHFFQYCES